MKPVLIVAAVGILFAGANYGALRLFSEDPSSHGAPSAGRESTQPPQGGERPAKKRAAARREAKAAAAFEKTATRICRSVDAKAKKLRTPRNPEELEAFLVAVRPLAYTANRRLARLTPPPRKKRLFAALVRRFPDDERLVDDLLAAVRRSDWSAAQWLIAHGEERSPTDRRLFRALGLPACAKIV